jgi:hypothetical protein
VSVPLPLPPSFELEGLESELEFGSEVEVEEGLWPKAEDDEVEGCVVPFGVVDDELSPSSPDPESEPEPEEDPEEEEEFPELDDDPSFPASCTNCATGGPGNVYGASSL